MRIYEKYPKLSIYLTYFIYFYTILLFNTNNKKYKNEDIFIWSLMGGFLGIAKYLIWIALKNIVISTNRELDIIHNFHSIKIIKSRIILILSFILVDYLLNFSNIIPELSMFKYRNNNFVDEYSIRLLQIITIFQLEPSDYIVTIFM